MVNLWAIHQHLARQMDDRLLLLRRAPRTILLHGADGDVSRSLLAKRYPQAILSEYDHRADYLQQASLARQKGWLAKLSGKKIAQYKWLMDEILPKHSAEMLWSNLLLPHSGEKIESLLANWAQALQDEGMLFFTGLGSTSAPQLRTILTESGVSFHAKGLPEMHDLGDMLLAHDFYDPIVDTVQLVLSYQDWATLQQDWQVLGIWRAIVPEDEMAAQNIAYQAWQNGQLREITLEILFGHALKKTILPNRAQAIQFYPRTEKSS